MPACAQLAHVYIRESHASETYFSESQPLSTEEKPLEKEHGAGVKPSEKPEQEVCLVLLRPKADVRGQEEEGLVRKIL